MKFYEEGTVGDRMSRLKGNKLPLSDVLRYGADLAWGIVELHSKEILLLNLKPYNFLLRENDQAILGDIGIPYLLLGIPLSSLEITPRLGTPCYMAPEQWQPEVRGPVSFETDSWGFACSIVEMLTGVHPWSGKSADEIYRFVVKKQEKPHIPGGLLPPAVEDVINGCFEYDFRNRPLMEDIFHAFKSSQGAVFDDGSWIDTWVDSGFRSSGMELLSCKDVNKWFLLKDHLQVGDIVRSRKRTNSSKSENMEIPEGIVVGLDRDSEQNGYVLVRVHGFHDPKRVHKSALERVTFGLAAGDWVRLRKVIEGGGTKQQHSPVGIIHKVNRDGDVAVAFIGLETLWRGSYAELQMAETYCVGQFVKLKPNISNPRFEWPRRRKRGGGEWATGRICQVLPNGGLIVTFPGRLTFSGDKNSSFLADPAEVEAVCFNTSRGMMKKYQHLEDFHWAVRPLLIALGLFAAMKVGLFAGKKIGRSRVKKERTHAAPLGSQAPENQLAAGNAAWLPPQVANYIFREGVTTPTPP
ncbi:OLC1v1028002C5 [Oldenlandia corymbosa var. corymbosa]|nr:OLC1v1028002C5 [Oldenlandia corymbosa var. corymbosa]